MEEGLEGFLKVGKSLLEIRDSRLYRSSHDTFDSYCRDRWALSLSRCNQLIGAVTVHDHLTTAFPEDIPLLADTNEHMLRPLTGLSEELQTAAWQLVREIEEHPNGKTIQETVTAIKDAIAAGWQERTETPLEADKVETLEPCHDARADHNGPARSHRSRTAPRSGDQLASLCRLGNRVTSWDSAAIAGADDELCAKRHLRAARQLKTFCEALIAALEARFSS
jgi:hypothetical protein